MKPGTKIAWMALTRERVGNHGRLTISRGLEVATPAGNVAIGRPGVDRSRSVWVMAAIDEALTVSTIPPGYEISPFPIEAQAIAGAERITITSPSIELLYVRRHGSAWFFTASDGGPADADGEQNTRITVALESLKALHGNASPPKTVGQGDVLLMIDPVSNRSSTVEVGR